MVEAPRSFLPSSQASLKASFISCSEKPWWLKNSRSSPQTAARFIASEIRAAGTKAIGCAFFLPAACCSRS